MRGRKAKKGSAVKGNDNRSLEDLVKGIPPELREQVRDFLVSLMERRVKRKCGPLRQDWAGSLREFKGKYTSLDLQKKALEWRGD